MGVRLDGNPLGEDEEAVRDGIEEALERRGRSAINCGDLVSHVKGGEVKWRKQPKPGTMRACVLENRNEPTIMNIAEIAACVDGLQEELHRFKESSEEKPQASHEKYLRDRKMVATLKQHPALQVWGEAAAVMMRINVGGTPVRHGKFFTELIRLQFRSCLHKMIRR